MKKRMTISEWQKLCYRVAVEKGFFTHSINFLLESYPYNHLEIMEKLMLIVSELGEASEALRENKFQKYNKKWKKDTFEDEISDAIIRLFILAEYMGIDIEWQMKKKLEYEKKRKYKHGKEF